MSARTSSAKISVAIVDDHPVVREGLRAFLQLAGDIEIVAEASSGVEAVSLVKEVAVDLVMMDLMMPGEFGGVEAIRRIHEEHPEIKLLALTSFQEEQIGLDALAAGAVGFLYKDVEPDLLLSGIRQAVAGIMVLEADVWTASQSGRRSPSAAEPAEPLTNREREVLREMGSGRSNKEIAAQLCISEKTVKVHVSHILGKLCVYDRTQAVLEAARLGMVDLYARPVDGSERT
jgi:two-component system, NarL family, response regulator LiaR